MITVKTQSDENIVLDFTNGDVEKFNAVMEKYGFKDAQSFIRFATSLLLVAQDRVIKIKKNNEIINVRPADEFLKKSEEK